MSIAQLVGVGAMFSGCVLAGFLLGIFASNRTDNPLWAIVGFFAGLIVGGCAAARQVASALRSPVSASEGLTKNRPK